MNSTRKALSNNTKKKKTNNMPAIIGTIFGIAAMVILVLIIALVWGYYENVKKSYKYLFMLEYIIWNFAYKDE